MSTVYSTAPPQATEAPARTPAQFGLFSVVTPSPSSGVRWENGLVWRDQQCGALPEVLDANCTDPSGIPLTFTQGQSSGAARAFTVYGDFLCSPVTWTPEEAQEAANERLFTREEETAAGHILTLLTSDAELEGSVIASTGTTWGDVALLEQGLAEEYGSQGVLLMSLTALYNLSTTHDLRWSQTTHGLMTPVGTPIAVVRTAEAAVPGFSAGIIPAPLLVRGDPFTSTPDTGSAQLLDRSQNDFYAAAFRTYAAGWNLDCGAAYIALAG